MAQIYRKVMGMGITRKMSFILLCLLTMLAFAACGASESNADIEKRSDTLVANQEEQSKSTEIETEDVSSAAQEEPMENTLILQINGEEIPVLWEENESVEALVKAVSSEPITIGMSMYGGFEQVGSLGITLPTDDVQTTTAAGDIVLYSGNQIVMFYGSNSWSYTRLGRIQEKTQEELTDLLGSGAVTVTLK